MKGAIFFLIFLPLASAFDCSQIKDKQFCNEVTASSLSQSDKNALLAAALYDNPDLSDHAFVEQWNANIMFGLAPEGVSTYNKGAIRDAWVKIVTVMPSVIDRKLLTPGYGKIQTASNYRIDMPSGTMPGDCATYYNLDVNEKQLTVTVNGNYIGDLDLLPYKVNADMDFRALLNIRSVISRRHYQNERYCCQYYKRGCSRYCDKCTYRYTDYQTNTLQLIDNLSAYYYKPTIQADIKLNNNYYQTISGTLTMKNYTSFSFESDNAYLEKYSYNYGLSYSLYPYYVLTLTAIPNERQDSRNINTNKRNDSFDFTLKENSKCTLKYYTHFNNYSKQCNLSFSSINISIRTDKLSYLDNEAIAVEVTPKEKTMELKYGNLTTNITNSLSLKAIYPYNSISINLHGIRVDKIIAVKKKDRFQFFMNIGIFSTLLCSVYSFIRKYLPFGLA